MTERTVKKESIESRMSGFQRLGLGVAGAFYVVSVVWVWFLSPTATTFDPDVTVLTLAHWQLEDGFREGMAEAIKQFEERKAAEGQKVRIIQTTVPFRGYAQWMLTQLVGGDPADLMEITGETNLQYMYFRSLSSYLGAPNPYNKGTVLEGIPWKDTYIDGMEGRVNTVYADWFQIPTTFMPTRLHVNLDLLKEATGSDKMPETLEEWLEICEKVKAYGISIQKPIGAIGVRGTDRGTLYSLYYQYYSETNGVLLDKDSRYCDGNVLPGDILKGMEEGAVSPERQTVAAAICRDLGQYFIEGFPSMDLEQAKYLFTRGMVAFFPTGTWETLSLQQNSKFRMGITRVPPIGAQGKYAQWYTGKTTESGVTTGAGFGIPKVCKKFDLALDFLKFISSYEANQMLAAKCQWGPGVREARYEGIQKALAPDLEGNPGISNFPFTVGTGSKSYQKMMEELEDLILHSPEDVGKAYLENFKGRMDTMIADQKEALIGAERANVDRELQRSQLSLGLLRQNATEEERHRLDLRRSLTVESVSERVSNYTTGMVFLKALEKY